MNALVRRKGVMTEGQMGQKDYTLCNFVEWV